MINKKTVLFLIFVIWSPYCLADEILSCTERYAIDNDHTIISWYAKGLGFIRTSGKFENFDGFINLNTCNPAASKIYITIETSSILSGVKKLDKQLKGPIFFDIENYPKVIFESTKIAIQEKNSADIKGDFTMLGKTREVVLSTRFNKRAMDPIVNRMRISYSIKTSIQRSLWGMDQWLKVVSDNIDIVIEAEALKVID